MASPPLYQQIALDLAGGIATGAYPVGSHLPTEAELCAKWRTPGPTDGTTQSSKPRAHPGGQPGAASKHARTKSVLASV